MNRFRIPDRTLRFGFRVALPLLLFPAGTGGAAGQALGSGARPPLLEQVGVIQRLGEPLPLELTFRDEGGRPVRLGRYFQKRPVVLALVYYECPTLCTHILSGLTRALRALPFEAGSEFEVVALSIDPRETPALAAARKARYLQQYGRPGSEAGWHFLTGEEASVRRLAEAVGFRYTYDPKRGQYAHASTIMVLTPEGKLSRYFHGIEYSPRDLKLSLMESASETIGSPVDQVLLYCYQYDPLSGKYGLLVVNVLRLAGGATLLALGSFIFLMLRRERRRQEAPRVG